MYLLPVTPVHINTNERGLTIQQVRIIDPVVSVIHCYPKRPNWQRVHRDGIRSIQPRSHHRTASLTFNRPKQGQSLRVHGYIRHCVILRSRVEGPNVETISSGTPNQVTTYPVQVSRHVVDRYGERFPVVIELCYTLSVE